MSSNPLLIASCFLLTAISAYAWQGQGGPQPGAPNTPQGVSQSAPTMAISCAADDGVVIEGKILAHGFLFDEYVEVLQLDEFRLVGFTYTNSRGDYELPEQPRGNYYVVARIEGFKEYRERVDLYGCAAVFDHPIFMEPEAPELLPVVLDFTGEVKEVVDVAELKQRFPKKAVEEFERARKDRIRDEREQARRRLEKLLENHPEFYDAHNVLGSIYLEMKLFREAEKQYNKARVLRPSSAAPLVSLGSLYVQEAEAALNPDPSIAGVVTPGDDLGVILDDARSVLLEAIRAKPDASFAYYLLGITEMRAGNNTRSESYLKRAFDMEPNLRWARLALANLYISQKKWSEAGIQLDAYLAEFKKVANRGEVQETRNKVALQLAAANTPPKP